MKKVSGEKDSQKYQDMLAAVEEIVGKLSTSDMDLDQLVSEVERGFGLLKNMRARLDATKLKVEEIKQEFTEAL